jgi:iron complex outermembrane recepter protein
MSIKLGLFGLGLGIGLISGQPAYAAEAKAQDTLEEVIVTAQNRTENVQKVPIAINVVSAEQIAESGFADMNDLGKVAPAVQIVNDNNAVRVTMRGVGTNSADEAQDTSIVVNVDGEYINRPNVLGVSLFDLERVEVLRGPQGTLYGRNSTGGAINFITRKAGDVFAANASASYGNYGAYRIDGGIDLPLFGSGGLRLSGITSDHDGYFSHPATPFAPAAKSGSEKNRAGRASLHLRPTDAFTLDFALEYAKRDFVNPAVGSADLNSGGRGPTGPGCNAPGFAQVAPNYTDTLCIPQSTNFLASIDRKAAFDQPLFGVGGYTQDSHVVRARASYRISPSATLTYTGGYRSSGGTGHQGLPVVYQNFTFQDDTKTESQEIRLNGELGRVTYQVGGFYFNEKLARETGFFLAFLNVPDFLCPLCGQDGTYLSYFGRYVESQSKSVFGQMDIAMNDQFKVVGGWRYTKNKRSAVFKNGNPFAFGPNNPSMIGAGPGRKDFDTIRASVQDLGNDEGKGTWLVGLNYTPADRTLIFGKVSTGFKGGGFDSIGTYRPETNTAYEVGIKKNFGSSGQHYINASAFSYDYKDLQVSVLLDTAVGGQIFNAGKATIWGLELEGGFKLSDNDAVTASANYLHAKYGELLGQYNVFCIPADSVAGCDSGNANGIGDLDPNTPGIQQPNFAGNTAPYSPKVVLALEYDHTFHLGSAGTLKASAASRYKSSYYTDFFNYNDAQQKAHTQSDVSLEYKPQGKHFSAQAFVRNLEDKRPLTNAGFISAGPDDIFNFQFGQPRTYGVRLGADF